MAAAISALTWDHCIPIQEQGESHQHQDAQGQDVGPPATPARAAVVTRWADDGLEQEPQDGADQPHQAVQAAGEPHTQQHRRDERCLHGVAEFPSEHDQTVENEAASCALGGLHGSKHGPFPTVHVIIFRSATVYGALVQSAVKLARLRDPAGLGSGGLVLWEDGHGWETEEEQKKGRRTGGGGMTKKVKKNQRDKSLVLGCVSLSQPGDALKSNYSIPAWVLSLSLILLTTA